MSDNGRTRSRTPSAPTASRQLGTSRHIPWQFLGAAILLVIAVVVAFGPLSRHPTDLLVGVQDDGRNDLTSFFISCRNYPRQCREWYGQWPFWNPFSGFGTPWLGNPQSALFYPPNWVFYWIDAEVGISWVLVAHHWFACLGTYLVARRYQLTTWASLLAGLAFGCAPYLLAQTGEGHFAQICVVSWVPWAVLAYERLRTKELGGGPLLLLTLAMCYFAGHVQEWVYLLLLLTGMALTDAAGRWREGSRAAALGLLGQWLLVAVGVVGFVAVDLLPTFIATTHSVRAGEFSSMTAGAIGIGWANMRQLIEPLALGDPTSYRGPGQFFWETLVFFGRLPLALSALGLFAAWKRYPVRRLLVIVILSIGFAFGAGSPVFEAACRAIPVLSRFRVPGRGLFFASYAVALLAAFGLDSALEWTRRGLARRGWWSTGTVLAAVAVLLTSAAELADFAYRILRTAPRGSLRHNPAIELILAHGSEPARVLADQELLPDLEAWTNGVQKTQTYDPALIWRSVAFVDAMTGTRDAAAEAIGFEAPDLSTYRRELLNLLNVRYLLLREQAGSDVDLVLLERGRRQTIQLRGREPRELDFWVYENSEAMSRAFVLGNVLEEPLMAGSISKLEQLDPRQALMLPRDVLAPGPRQSLRTAKVTEYTANRVVVEAELDAPGYLYLGDSWFPGWKAEVNGEPTPVLAANLAFRAVPLSAGSHRVVMEFQPPGFVLGAILTGITLAIGGYMTAREFEHTRGSVRFASATPLR